MNTVSTPSAHLSESFRDEYKPAGLSVVIPNYNGKNLFARTMEPLFSVLKELTIPYEVIVVDDCSTDDSVSFLEERFPQIKILKNETNAGFSVTINKGIFACKYELVFLLNSDIIVTPGYFNNQFKYFGDRDTFGVMGRIIGWDDYIIQDTARFPEHHGTKIKTSCNYLLDEMNGEPLYTLYLSGANALVSREKLIELGGFDEIYSPFYIEDCDLSFRAWRLGWKCYYDHQSVCRHRTSSSIKNKSRKHYIETIYNRNKLFLHAIHLNRPLFALYFLQTAAEAVLKMLLFRFTLIKSFGLFIAKRGDCLRSRNRFKKLQEKHNAAYTLSDVSEKIRNSVHLRKVVKFRSGQLKIATAQNKDASTSSPKT